MAETNTAQTPAPDTSAKGPQRVTGTTPTPASNADMSPQDRWAQEQKALSDQDPWLDHSKVLTRDASGNLVQRAKVAGADGEPQAGKPLADPNSEAPPAPGDQPTETKIRVGETEFSEQEIRDAIAAKAEADLRRTQIPESPHGYKLELPKDAVLPNGVQFQFAKLDDPLRGPALKSAMEWAHRNSISQGQFSEMMLLYANANSSVQIAINNAAQREKESIGANGGVRVDAVLRWVAAHYPTAIGPVKATLATKAQLEMLEDIIGRRSNQGSGSFRRTGSEPDIGGKVDDATYDKWSYSEKKDYAARWNGQ